MSEVGEPGPDEMQFDQAEYEDETTTGTVCGVCNHDIEDEYYECNGVLLCGTCRDAVGYAISGGSGITRFLKASVYGFAAAIAGFAIYFGILKATGAEIGLISILVGLIVGYAVRKGSSNRGGWVYQLLAMFLVYTAIVASYSAVVIPMWLARQPKANAVKAGGKQPPAAGAPAAMGAAEKPDRLKNEGLPKLLGQFAIALIVLIGFLYALPVVVGIQHPIGLMIIAFALWEAWKINRKVPIVFNGPFAVGDGYEDASPGGEPGYA